MHIIITGANGFIGEKLATRILANPSTLIGDKTLTRLTLMDLQFNQESDDPLVKQLTGSFADPAILKEAVNDLPADLVFHLASVPSGAAENNYSLGVDVNINGVLNLLDTLHQQGNVPSLVFASSIAVYGKPSGAQVDESTLPTPNLSYGSQKVIGETLVADYIRRGWIKGCSIRLPGIVVRPPEPNGAVSIFFSDLIRSLVTGNEYTCPVSPQAKSWLMSAQCCVDNLIHGAVAFANIEKSDSNASTTTWTLPALHLSIAELVDAIDQLYPQNKAKQLIDYQPDTWVEDNFGSYPPLYCTKAEASGFKHDGSLSNLISHSMK